MDMVISHIDMGYLVTLPSVWVGRRHGVHKGREGSWAVGQVARLRTWCGCCL